MRSSGYEAEEPGLGPEFLEQLRLVYRRILENPLGYEEPALRYSTRANATISLRRLFLNPFYGEFMPDIAGVGQNVIVGGGPWQEQLAANKEAFLAEFVQRAAFRQAYDNLSDSRYVDELMAHTGISFAPRERDELVNGLADNTLTRSTVLLRIAEDGRFVSAKRNEMFVMMEYFGYLRRDPDESGYQFWVNKLNQFGGDFQRAEMVKAFIISSEYRMRFRR